MSEMFRVVPLLLPVLLFAPLAGAQTDGDMRELRGYRLTMAAVRQVDAATQAMAAEMKKDPKYLEYLKLETEISALEKKGAPTEADDARLEQLRERRDALEASVGPRLEEANTLSEWEAAIRQYPPMARGLRAAGMSPRDYAKFMLSMLGAGTVAGFKKAGLVKGMPKELEAVVSAENVKFVEEHAAELTALQRKWEAGEDGAVTGGEPSLAASRRDSAPCKGAHLAERAL